MDITFAFKRVIADGTLLATWQQLDDAATDFVAVAQANSGGGIVLEPSTFSISRNPTTLKLTEVNMTYSARGLASNLRNAALTAWDAIVAANSWIVKVGESVDY